MSVITLATKDMERENNVLYEIIYFLLYLVVLTLGMKVSLVYKTVPSLVYHIARKQIKRFQVVKYLIDYFIWNCFKYTIFDIVMKYFVIHIFETQRLCW